MNEDVNEWIGRSGFLAYKVLREKIEYPSHKFRIKTVTGVLGQLFLSSLNRYYLKL